MPNIASAFKDEIVRLARKEVRKESESLKKASTQYRSDIAALKRQVAALEKALGRAEKKQPRPVEASAEATGGKTLRFSATRFASQRKKLGLTAAEMGTVIGVSAQTVYNWEAGKSRPRQAQLAAIATLRTYGKRQIKALLEPKAE